MKILVVDDEPAIRFSLAELLEAEGHEVRQAEHAPAALALLEADGADLVRSDLRMPAMDGMDLLSQVRARHPDALFVLMTAHGDERLAVRTLKAGAYDQSRSRSTTTKSARLGSTRPVRVDVPLVAWPGNVRELRNTLERAVVLAERETITLADLPPAFASPGAPVRPAEAALAGLGYAEARDRALWAFERAFHAAPLERHDGNVSRTAKALGMHRQSLQKVMRRAGLGSECCGARQRKVGDA